MKNKLITVLSAAMSIIMLFAGCAFDEGKTTSLVTPLTTVETKTPEPNVTPSPSAAAEPQTQDVSATEVPNATPNATPAPSAKFDEEQISEQAREKLEEAEEIAEESGYVRQDQTAEIPNPITPSKQEIGDNVMSCTLSVRCDSLLSHMDELDESKKKVVPSDGVIFAAQTVEFFEGESVFDLVKRTMRDNKIHFEFSQTPVYGSAYIEGINNIYEFDCGNLSGWMYCVNGVFPNYGCSMYGLKDGDSVEILYTCDMGIDIGGYGGADR